MISENCSDYNELNELPFYNLDRSEFVKACGVWDYSITNQSIIDAKDLFQDIIECPDREANLHENPYSNNIESRYYDIKQTDAHFQMAKKQRGFSIMHFNTRSPPKIYCHYETYWDA